MRKVTGGSGLDTTAATQSWLASAGPKIIRDLMVIGYLEDPRAIWLTNHEGPVIYSPYGKFYPAVVTRDKVTAKIGLDVASMTVTWSPGNIAATVNTATASPAQLARLHTYDNWPIQILRCFMPTPGDANTLGCTPWFGGRVDTCQVGRNKLVFKCSSNFNVLSQKVPSTVIEVTNTLAGTTPVNLPAGDASIPRFTCFAGSSENQIIADCTGPTADKIYSGNLFAGGYMIFLSGAGATLAGAWSAIAGNGKYKDGDGNSHSIFSVYSPLPWPPTTGVDTFYVSTTPPINLGDEGYFGFPYVPNPQQAV
jgi:hypothetical protein